MCQKVGWGLEGERRRWWEGRICGIPQTQRCSISKSCTPSIPGTRYLQQLLWGNWSLWISALKNITPIRLEISPKVAPEQGRRSMLFNIKLFTKMTFIMLMAKSHWLWRSQNEAISKGCDSPSKRARGLHWEPDGYLQYISYCLLVVICSIKLNQYYRRTSELPGKKKINCLLQI